MKITSNLLTVTTGERSTGMVGIEHETNTLIDYNIKIKYSVYVVIV